MRSKNRVSVVALATFFLMGSVAAAAAAEVEAEGTTLTEITVTAQKREQNLQDVGTSMAVLTREEILQRGMIDMTSITQQAVGVEMIQFSPSFTNLSIRGVSQASYADNLEAPIAVYVDDAYVSAGGAISGSLFDMRQIEVLRGPQGTLFGRNATGGLIHYITNKPTEDPEADFTVTGAQYGEVDVQGAVSGPIGGGLLGRLAFSYNHDDGYLRNTAGPDGPQQKNYALRLQLADTFGESTHALLALHYSRNPNEAATSYVAYAAYPNAQGLGAIIAPNQNPWGTCPGCNAYGYRYPDPAGYVRTSIGPDNFDRTVRGLTLTTTSQLGAAQLTSVTDYFTMGKEWAETSDPSPTPILLFSTTQDLRQFSQELRLSGKSGGLQWVGGVYYLDIKQNDGQVTDLPTYSLDYFSTANQYTRSEAAFGQLEYAISDKFSGILGARYSFDQKSLDVSLNDGSQPQQTPVYTPSLYPDAKRDFNGFSGKAELDYRPTDGVLLYGSINRGYKGGNWNIPILTPIVAASIPHGAEELTSYELGEKATFAGGRIRLNGDVFYYDYHDYQAYEDYNLTPSIYNKNATLVGTEIELTAALLRGLTAQLSYAGLASRVADVGLPDGEIAGSREMPMSPKLTTAGLLRYEWPAFNGTLSLQAEGKYDSPVYFTTLNAPVERRAALFLGDVRGGYSFKTNGYAVDLTAFVRNVTNRVWFTYGVDTSSLGFAQYSLAPPRIFGGTVQFHFR
jgi:iron complex outermembrane receptor protein